MYNVQVHCLCLQHIYVYFDCMSVITEWMTSVSGCTTVHKLCSCDNNAMVHLLAPQAIIYILLWMTPSAEFVALFIQVSNWYWNFGICRMVASGTECINKYNVLSMKLWYYDDDTLMNDRLFLEGGCHFKIMSIDENRDYSYYCPCALQQTFIYLSILVFMYLLWCISVIQIWIHNNVLILANNIHLTNPKSHCSQCIFTIDKYDGVW